MLKRLSFTLGLSLKVFDIFLTPMVEKLDDMPRFVPCYKRFTALKLAITSKRG